LRIDARGLCLSLQEAINTSATSTLGRISGLPFCFNKLFFEGCLIGRFVQTVAVMLCSFGGLGSVSAMGDAL